MKSFKKFLEENNNFNFKEWLREVEAIQAREQDESEDPPEDYRDKLRERGLKRGLKQPVATHDKVVDSIVKQSKGGFYGLEGDEIREILNNHHQAPFMASEHAMEALQDYMDAIE